MAWKSLVQLLLQGFALKNIYETNSLPIKRTIGYEMACALKNIEGKRLDLCFSGDWPIWLEGPDKRVANI